MKKLNNLLLTFLLFSNFVFAQKFYLNLKGADSITEKELIIEYKDDYKQVKKVKSFEIKKIKLEHLKNSKLRYIKLKINSDTLFLKSENVLQNIGVNISSGFDEVINDTLNVFLDTYPYKHKGSPFVVNRFSIDKLPDHTRIMIIQIDNDAFVVKWPIFKLDKHSEYFADLIKDDFCNCMADKTFDRTNFKEVFDSCLNEPMTKTIPLMETTLKNYIYKNNNDINYADRVNQLINEVLLKVNLHYNKNCFKK
ncbi:hypothetical protein KFZ70_02470 [Tamlana fucoidanivorans]|uniref:Uncharacterized protein n=1 Tax=Allotamlana fucoidanivorans TaxID=2583814 RepID=A0A5C4SCE4_9FLAO|nr:hypothetical protein [Tamlana fucoidanivorans]TNJ40848.1 hypothetical protein FGF67_16735 [Tamlana fucoidanivorans]